MYNTITINPEYSFEIEYPFSENPDFNKEPFEVYFNCSEKDLKRKGACIYFHSINEPLAGSSTPELDDVFGKKDIPIIRFDLPLHGKRKAWTDNQMNFFDVFQNPYTNYKHLIKFFKMAYENCEMIIDRFDLKKVYTFGWSFGGLISLILSSKNKYVVKSFCSLTSGNIGDATFRLFSKAVPGILKPIVVDFNIIYHNPYYFIIEEANLSKVGASKYQNLYEEINIFNYAQNINNLLIVNKDNDPIMNSWETLHFLKFVKNGKVEFLQGDFHYASFSEILPYIESFFSS